MNGVPPVAPAAEGDASSQKSRGNGTPPANDWHADHPYFPFLDEVRATGVPNADCGSDSDDDNISNTSNSLGRSRGRRSLNRIKDVINQSAETLGLADASSSTSSTSQPPTLRDPATGLSMALERDNAEFHRIFSSVSQTEGLVDDYACAWNRDGLLIQGRMWISQRRVCFKGWTPGSTLCMMFGDILSLEKKSIALVFSNSLEIETSSGKFFFASFFNRDETFHTLKKLWDARIQPCTCAGLGTCEGCFLRARSLKARASADDVGRGRAASTNSDGRRLNGSLLDEASGASSASLSLSNKTLPPTASDSPTLRVTPPDGKEGEETSFPTPPVSPAAQRKSRGQTPARCGCGADHQRMRTLLEETYPAPVEQIWDKWFAVADANGGWYGNFLTDNRKIKDLNVGPWVSSGESTPQPIPLSLPAAGYATPFSGLKVGLRRSLEYVMPLSGPIGPKQTRAKTSEEILAASPTDGFVCLSIRADTPDVPSGNAFHVVTRICLLHAGGNSTKVIVTTEIVFTKSSWIRGAIERATPEAQLRFYKELDESLKTVLLDKGPSSSSSPPTTVPTKNKKLTVSPTAKPELEKDLPVTPKGDSQPPFFGFGFGGFGGNGDAQAAASSSFMGLPPSVALVTLLVLIFAALCSLTIQAVALYKVLGVLERVEERIVRGYVV
ncbi:hypothetical protein HKX48_002537 [Thoreauomyces humboldtii]|nr:hypothetical protein HKX48_002537 [Thoreauomyces humboldtii]